MHPPVTLHRNLLQRRFIQMDFVWTDAASSSLAARKVSAVRSPVD